MSIQGGVSSRRLFLPVTGVRPLDSRHVSETPNISLTNSCNRFAIVEWLQALIITLTAEAVLLIRSGSFVSTKVSIVNVLLQDTRLDPSPGFVCGTIVTHARADYHRGYRDVGSHEKRR